MGQFDFLHSNSSSTREFKPFTFHSDRHQRYESECPVYGLQTCGRIISVDKNVNGCEGYIIEPGVGFIVRAKNEDTGREQFAPKPMKIISHSSQKTVLRGYMTKARTPFGYEDFDLSDYGLEVYYKDGAVDKCVLHMYDRDTHIEYMGNEVGSSMRTNEGDVYSKIIENATYNPFNLSTDPMLNRCVMLPDVRNVFRRELESTFDNLGSISLPQSQWERLLSGYIFSLLESYFKNAGVLPQKAMDIIIEQVYDAVMTSRYKSRFGSLTLRSLKDRMYHALTTP